MKKNRVKKGGRPKGSRGASKLPEDQRTERIKVMLSPKEMEEVDERRGELSRSGFVRTQLFRR